MKEFFIVLFGFALFICPLLIIKFDAIRTERHHWCNDLTERAAYDKCMESRER